MPEWGGFCIYTLQDKANALFEIIHCERFMEYQQAKALLFIPNAA